MSRRVYLPLIGIAVFLVLVIARLPLPLVLALSDARGQGLDWSAAEGTVWSGVIGDVTVDGYPVGRVEVNTGFLPLLTGRASVGFTVSGRALNGEGRAVLAGDRVIFSDTALLANLAAYNITDAFGANMNGVMRVETERLVLDGQRCFEGAARLWTDTLTYSARSYGGEGFPLAGTASCDESADINVVMSGEAEQGDESASLDVTLEPTLDYLAEVRAGGVSGDAVSSLLLYGFEREGDQLVLIQRGNLLDPQ